MKRNDFIQLKTKPVAELRKLLGESRDRLWSLRIDLRAGKVKNVKEIKKIKKDIARVLTLLRQQPTTNLP